MSSASNTVIELVKAGKLRITEHGQEALLDDGIGLDEILLGIADAHEIEYYPDAFKGPSVLLLQKIRNDQTVHVLWGLSKSNADVASLITAYFPNVDKWYDGFMKRRPK